MNDDVRRDPQTTDSAASDRTEGTMKEAKGRTKESWGALTGNEQMKAQGEKDQMAGTARRKKGEWKDRLKAWIDRR